MDIDYLHLREYRRARFRVNAYINPHKHIDTYGEDTYVLQMTFNGNQWQTHTLLKDEIQKIIEVLQRLLDNGPPSQNQ
jgi:hypothetical protein